MNSGFITAYERAIADPDIPDVEDFIGYVKTHLETNPEFYHVTPDTSPFAKQVMDASGYDRVNSLRPGMKSSLSKTDSSLRNDPYRNEDYEVWNPDTIPMHVYAKMRRDPDIKFNTLLLKGWISSLTYSIEADSEEVKRVVDRAIASIYTSTVRNMLTSIAYGFAFGEKVWERRVEDLSDPEGVEDRLVIKRPVLSLRKIKFIDPRANLKFWKNKHDDLVYVTQYQSANKVKVKRNKLVWFILDEEFGMLFGESRYKGIYNEWYQSTVTLQQLVRHVHRTGSPPLKIRYVNGAIFDPELGENVYGHEIANSMARTYMTQGIILLPSERDEKGEYKWDMSFDKVDNTDTTPFTNVMDALTRRKAKGIGVPPSMSDGAGTMGEANTQAESLIIVVEDLVDQIERSFQTDIVDQVVEYNFGPQAVSSVKFKIEKSGLGRRKLFKEIFVNVLRTMMSKQDFVPTNYPDIVEMGEELGIPMRRLDKQVTAVESPNSGMTPDAQARADEDSNNERHRPNPQQRDNQSKTPSDTTTGEPR